MLFSSFTFLFGFLPVVLILYHTLPTLQKRLFPKSERGMIRLQNTLLLLFSLLFYAWGEPIYLLLIVGVVFFDFATGRGIPRAKRPRLLLFLSVTLHVLLLFFFKYAAFFANALGLSFHAPTLPLGISFYTFQALSYIVDVYRHDVPPAKTPLDFGAYLTFFPQLVAGPIVRYSDMQRELQARTLSPDDLHAGTVRFICGLCKKVLLANPAGALFASLSAAGSFSFVGTWLCLLGFFFQIYFDFSGYSDMAIGLGRLFGFHFPENFNYPYIATSFSDFWKRWHITLTSFFRSYVYIPLGGNRKGCAFTLRNMLLVWLLTGLWHGAAWNFLLWGGYCFLLLAAERFVFPRLPIHLPRPLRRLLTLLAILFGWLLFALDGSTRLLSLSSLGPLSAALLGVGRGGFLAGNELYELVRHIPFLLLCALFSTPFPKESAAVLSRKRFGFVFHTVLPLFGFLLSVASLVNASYNPFLYFRF